MASSSQSLTTNIIINAKAGSGFDTVASTLNQMAEMVSGITQSLFGFGKDSVDVYKTYEKAMAEVEGALATQYGRGSNQLSRYMDSLNEKAAEWASTTIFHTDDVANAMVEAARSGWDYDQILAGIPASMELAQAGGLDLTQAVDYVVKASNAGGVAFENMGTFIDHWAYAANSSATNIGELGDAMLRMGKTMSFTSSQDELLTMLAVLADNGYTGAEAGTLLRNTMLRLIAPTDKAEDAMASLGLTAEEVNEAIGGSDVETATKTLEQYGFSAYTTAGELKPMTEIFGDLNKAISGMTEEQQTDILSAIFPTRTITGALSLLGELGTEGQALIDRMNQGEAEGYAEYLANLNMDTVYGDLETMYSKLEEMKRMVGETLAGDVRDVVSSISDLVNNVNGLDTSTFSALVGGLEGMAGSGAVITTAASGINLLKTAVGGWPVLGFTAAAMGIGFLAGSLEKLADVEYENAFGLMDVDPAAVKAHIEELDAAFASDNANINELKQTMSDLTTSYTDLTGKLSSELLTDLLTEHAPTEQELTDISDQGKAIGKALMDGIKTGYDLTTETIFRDMGGEEGTENNPIWENIIDTLSEGHADAVAEAERLSKELQDALTKGLKDGLSQEDLKDIRSIFDEMNKLFEEQARIESARARGEAFYKAQTLGLESFEETMDTYETSLDSQMATLVGEQQAALETLNINYENRYNKAKTDSERQAIEKEWSTATSTLEESQKQTRLRQTQQKAAEMGLLTDEFMSGSMPEAWDAIKTFGQNVAASGGLVSSEDLSTLRDTVGENANIIERAVNYAIDKMGGEQQVADFADYFETTGDIASANIMRGILNASAFANNPLLESTEAGGGLADAYGSLEADIVTPMTTLLSGVGKSVQDLAGAVEKSEGNLNAYQLEPEGSWLGTRYGDKSILGSLELKAEDLGFENIPAWVSGVQEAMGNAATAVAAAGAHFEGATAAHPETETHEIVTYTQEAAPQAMETQTFTATLDTSEAEGAIDSLNGQSVDLDVNAETGAAEGVIQGLDGQNLMEFVDGDISALSGAIDTQDGRHITVSVGGNTASLASAINSYANRTITVNVRANKIGFATGGRATEASIFGEAGPEWAIPEEHTENTAMLLNAAREASGFTWPELLQRFGGLNANANNVPSTLIYSPTINAADANGVDEVLKADKDRLEKWFEDKKLHDSVEVYQ